MKPGNRHVCGQLAMAYLIPAKIIISLFILRAGERKSLELVGGSLQITPELTCFTCQLRLRKPFFCFGLVQWPI